MAKLEKMWDPDRCASVVDRAVGELNEALFGPDGMPWGTSFDELETAAMDVAARIAREIMRRATAAQAESVPPEGEACPQCGRTGQTVGGGEPRIVLTRAGDVEWLEPQRRCSACRRAFFPSVPQPGDRPDGA